MSGEGEPGAAGQSWRPMLAARPVRNAAAVVTRRGDGRVSLTVRRELPGWLVPPVSWVIHLKPTRTFALDRLGTQVWGLCDGERTVEAIVDAFAAEHRLTFHEARVAVGGYLRSLVARGALAMVMAQEERE